MSWSVMMFYLVGVFVYFVGLFTGWIMFRSNRVWVHREAPYIQSNTGIVPLFRRMMKKDDLLILFAENDYDAERLMRLGEKIPVIVGKTPYSEGDNYSERDSSGALIKSGKRAQLQIWFKGENEG